MSRKYRNKNIFLMLFKVGTQANLGLCIQYLIFGILSPYKNYHTSNFEKIQSTTNSSVRLVRSAKS